MTGGTNMVFYACYCFDCEVQWHVEVKDVHNVTKCPRCHSNNIYKPKPAGSENGRKTDIHKVS